MAESKAVSQIIKQLYPKQSLAHITTESIDAGVNDFIGRLHEAMDFYQLFDTFIDHLTSLLPCDSVEYKDEDSQISLVNGVAGKHSCSYVLKYGGESLGNICFTRDTRFLDHEIKSIEIILAGLTLPLRNALRYQQAIRFAQRDSLTGLRNSSYYYDFFESEIERAHRYNKSFSLLKIDLDDFEAINNRYGSDTGDAILYEVAKRILLQARSCDIVYRNGGDEFLVFLPNTEKEEAMIAANRIKDFVLASSFADEKNDISFTLSAGVVTVEREDTASKLIGRVGKALFHAKILGKNRIYSDLSTEDMSAGCAR